MFVIKANGERARFNPSKILRTLKRAGASDKLASKIVSQVKSKVHDGSTTRQILDTALGLLKNQDPIVGARYDLKRAIMNLGPTGFPFEQFFAEVLKHHGYEVQVGKIFKGKLIPHEIDVVAKKDKKYMVECKYHNAPGIYTNIKVALYVYARFLDLKNQFDQPWLATNTKFSSRVLTYAKGIGMKFTSWEHPRDASLRGLIQSKKLYPITILKSVNEETKVKLSRANILLAADLAKYNIKQLKKKIGIPENILMRVLEEAKDICDIEINGKNGK